MVIWCFGLWDVGGSLSLQWCWRPGGFRVSLVDWTGDGVLAIVVQLFVFKWKWYEARVSSSTFNIDMNPNRIHAILFLLELKRDFQKVCNSEWELRRVILMDRTMEEWIGHSGTAVCWLVKSLLQLWKSPALNWHCLAGSCAMQFESIPYATWGVRKTYSFISNKNTSKVFYILYIQNIIYM